MVWSDWTSVFGDLNYWAILVSGVAVMALGSVWYMKAVFGKTWLKLVGLKEMNSDNIAMVMISTFILTLISAWGLAVLERIMSVSGWVEGATLGFFLGILFVATNTLINFLYERRSLLLWKLNAAYATLGLAIIGIILAVWPK